MTEQTLRSELHHGDCLDIMPTLAAGSVAMVFADLPYGVTHNHWDSLIDIGSLWSALAHACQRTSAMAFTATQPFASTLVSSNLKHFRYDLIWHKNRAGGFLNAKRMPLRAHESILIFYAKLPTYNALTTCGPAYSIAPPRPENNGSNYGHFVKRPQTNSGIRQPTSVLNIKSEWNFKGHPTQKPVALLEWLIKTYTHAGDAILDPCAGSGTTAIAALRTGRHSICIERDPGYFDVMQKRVAAERQALGLPP